jgi:hypothetical protein
MTAQTLSHLAQKSKLKNSIRCKPTTRSKYQSMKVFTSIKAIKAKFFGGFLSVRRKLIE